MKETLLITITLFVSTILFGQRGFAPLGAEWYYTFVFLDEAEHYYKYVSEEETIINDESCKVINIYYDNEDEIIYSYILKASDDKVEILYENEFYPIMYNNLSVDDTITLSVLFKTSSWDFKIDSILPIRYEVISTSNVIYEDWNFKRHAIKIIEEDQVISQYGVSIDISSYFYENIGYYNELLPFTVPVPELLAFVKYFRCYTDNEKQYITNSWINTGLPCDYYTSIEEYDTGLGVKIYPLPFDNYLNIETMDAAEIFIYNIYGREIRRMELSENDNYIDTSNLLKGIYVLCVKIDNKLKCYKIIKQ